MKPKWQKKLKKSEVQHIKITTDSGTLAQFKRNREEHHKFVNRGEREPCYDCKLIAGKLGMK